jgi:hypothetical protein
VHQSQGHRRIGTTQSRGRGYIAHETPSALFQDGSCPRSHA